MCVPLLYSSLAMCKVAEQEYSREVLAMALDGVTISGNILLDELTLTQRNMTIRNVSLHNRELARSVSVRVHDCLWNAVVRLMDANRKFGVSRAVDRHGTQRAPCMHGHISLTARP